MIPGFKWKNCFADVRSGSYPRLAKAFLRDVVRPSLEALDAQVEAWSRSEAVGAPFILQDTEELLRATTNAFCLSIQSMWERQLRTYLVGCAQELSKDQVLVKRALTDDWSKLDKLFYELRGLRLSQFDDYETLDVLQLLGNACRHGDGRSAEALWKKRPDLWPDWARPDKPLPGFQSSPPYSAPTINYTVIPRTLVEAFVDAIASFWCDAEYIYLESLESQSTHVRMRLGEIRIERS